MRPTVAGAASGGGDIAYGRRQEKRRETRE
jgi:hypothetical protein